MHYYQFNIGDYSSHTNHLDPLEDIAYRRMMDWCYLHESSLPTDIKEIARLIRMREECERIEGVLREFFYLFEDGYKHKRVDSEVERYHEKSSKAKASADARWNKAREDANALQTDSESNANQEPLTTNHKPITKDQTLLSSPKGDNVPFVDIVNLYHDQLSELPKCEILNKKRKGYIRQRWQDKEHGLYTLQHWENFFKFIRKSDFLMGRTQSRDGRPPFRANLEWITNLNNYTKIYEDKYHGQ